MVKSKSISELLKYVDILGDTSAIVVGESFAIDGFAEKPVRVISHAHYDHIVGLKDSILYSKQIVATPPTHDLILTLGYVGGRELRMLYKNKMVRLNYYEEYTYGGEKLVLIPSHHIIGSAQVLIEIGDLRIGYTGDFKLGENTKIMDGLDILIIESTYGDPSYRRPFKNEVEDLLVDIVLDGLEMYGKVVIFGYHGKIQEAMQILRRNGVKEPFLMPKRIYEVTRIAEKYGYEIGGYYNMRSLKGREILKSNRYILFEHFNKANHRRLGNNTLYIVLSGWEFNGPIKKIDRYTWLVALSDHADFDELIEYVEKAEPRLVIVDGSRQGSAEALANELNKRGWKSLVLPGPRVLPSSII
ncbi:MBL fold metallo-hydrolase [Staphylothermus hellenicus]|uniref:Metallo-beta-lactamase domain-containing protein n=1 Tax=Staphylothermus hellenicus (strain DSM 12710 / JCM 10830 / BK20S6-10-b1 / P8) TaxID=591019 RepID=D7DBB6_STAHD|nr:MBL fold metallo-hydrolase [Staphylothermus hellenicus]ADI31463.1 conserved hypothetical protein [Staphylothermus hellenicus DSM 12710]